MINKKLTKKDLDKLFSLLDEFEAEFNHDDGTFEAIMNSEREFLDVVQDFKVIADKLDINY